MEQKPAAYRQYSQMSGHTFGKPMHRCTVCDHLVFRSCIPSEACPLRKVKVWPFLKERRKQWKAWGKDARAKTKKRKANQ